MSAVIPLSDLATQANNTVLGNISGGAAVPSALTDPVVHGLVLNQATLTNPAPVTDTVLHVTGVDGAQPAVLIDSFGNQAPVFLGRKAQGTSAAPTTLSSGATYFFIGGLGYDGTAYSGLQGGISVQASETWAVGSHGTRLAFYTTLNGSASVASVGTIDGAGNLLFNGSFQGGNPNGGTAAAWKGGIKVTAASVFNTTGYIQLDVGGVLWKVALCV